MSVAISLIFGLYQAPFEQAGCRSDTLGPSDCILCVLKRELATGLGGLAPDCFALLVFLVFRNRAAIHHQKVEDADRFLRQVVCASKQRTFDCANASGLLAHLPPSRIHGRFATFNTALR